MEIAAPSISLNGHYDTENKNNLEWIEPFLLAVHNSNIIHIELQEETTVDQFVLNKHAGIMRAAPNIHSEFPPVLSFRNFEHMEKFLETLQCNNNWSSKNKLRIMFGMPVISNADNNHAQLKEIVHKIVSSPNRDLYQISFVQGWDMYNNSDTYAESYADTLKELGNKNCYFYLCNTSILRQFEQALPGCNPVYYAIYPTRLTNLPVSQTHPKYFNQDARFKNKYRTRKIMCLNNTNKPHREDIVTMLSSYNEKDQYVTLRTNNIFLKHEDILGPLPGGTHGHQFLAKSQDCPPLKYMTDVYTYIATETYHESLTLQALKHELNIQDCPVDGFSEWWTEKTFKGIYYELPFMIAGVAGSLKGLKGLGFETFPEWFDESYDNMDLWDDKKHIIEKNISNIMSKSHTELHDLYYSVSVQNKLKHNKDLFWHLIDKDPFK